jgi:hypothetical protein
MWKLNQFKTQANPLASATNLNMARDVLKANPIAMPPLSVV